MSANAIFAPSALRRAWSGTLLLTCVLMLFPLCAPADDTEEAEMAVARLIQPLEKAGFDFRADVWERDLKPDVGKAVRVQLFKGNEYRVCIAVSERSGIRLEGQVLDADGANVVSATDNRGWGLVLTVKPRRTGVYVITIRQAGGKTRTATCTMIMGYK